LWPVVFISSGLLLGLTAVMDVRLTILLGLGGLGAVVGLLLLQRPYWALLALTASLPMQVGVELSNGAEVSPQLLLLTGLLLALVMLAGGRANGRLWRTPYWPLWLLYIALSTIAILRGPVIDTPLQGAWALYRLVWTAPLVYPLTWVYLRDPMRIRRGLGLLVSVSAVGAAIAIIQTLTQGRILSGLSTNLRYLGFLHPLSSDIVAAYSGNPVNKLFVTGSTIFRGHGTFIEHNGFGVFLSVTTFLTWGIFAESRGRRRTWLFLALLLQLAGVVVTFSRSAWAAVFLGAVWLFVWRWRRLLLRRRSALNLVGFSLISILLTAVALWRTPELVTRFITIFSPSEVPEFSWRILLWQYAGTQIAQHPLFGVGTSMINRELAGIPGTDLQYSSHNLFIDIAYQRGLPALFIYLFFWLVFFATAWRILRRSAVTQISRPLIFGIMTAGFAFLVSGIGTPSMAYYNLAILFWFLFGSMVSLGAFSNELVRLQNQPPDVSHDLRS
jgi:O-antigen ligase